MKDRNIILLTDSYKVSHYKQYPPDTTHIYSYLESRGGKFQTTIFFGLQYFLKEYLSGCVVTGKDITDAMTLTDKHFGCEVLNVDGWNRIVDEHCGRLPVTISALPEGTVCGISTPLMTIENTDPELPWLTNYLETLLSQLWYPITVATQSYHMKKTLNRYLQDTGTPEDIQFKLHDFGFRGVSSVETAGIGGAGHLVNFMGTDNLAAITMMDKYYGADCCGHSIPASEHSTMTSWGRKSEGDAFRNMLAQYPTGPVACVSDSYNIYEACENIWGTILKDEVMSRNGVLVIRPDSGDPIDVTIKCLNILGNKFGCTVNDKGYKVLDPHVRLIQGDGIDMESIGSILEVMKLENWSADNIAFGSGGALLQKMNRDTNSFAMKCSNITRSGIDCPVFKDPIGDMFKKSKQGRFKGLTEVFRDGNILVEYSLDEIRERCKIKAEMM